MPEVAARTHIGYVRTNNEDAHVVSERVFVVADGLGGHPGGEVASDIAARTAHDVLAGADTLVPTADAAFGAAHAAMAAEAARDPRLARMGTTLVTATVEADGTVLVASAGDSRVYWLDSDALRQVTRDDNEAEHLLAAGVLDEHQARHHPGQHVLTNCLIADDDTPQVHQEHLVQPPGRLLLCTDGLTGEVDDPEIALLLGSGTVEQAADALVRAALDAGGSDNVTVVVVDL